jgi:hypothetical protein
MWSKWREILFLCMYLHSGISGVCIIKYSMSQTYSPIYRLYSFRSLNLFSPFKRHLHTIDFSCNVIISPCCHYDNIHYDNIRIFLTTGQNTRLTQKTTTNNYLFVCCQLKEWQTGSNFFLKWHWSVNEIHSPPTTLYK